MRHFHEELNTLKLRVAQMAALVEISVGKSIEALILQDSKAADIVFEKEEQINRLEMEIDDKGHSLFALGQPMAADLRLVTSILKANTDLERLGDHAVNIAERARELKGEKIFDASFQIPEMTLAVRKMLADALRAFISGDAALARQVLESDDVVDTYNDSLYARIEELLQKYPALIKAGMKLARIGHDLERIADLANNLAEDTVYLTSGREVRHRIGML